MLLGHKQKLHYRSQPSQDFDKFMKIRSEKKSVIQSGTQSIHQKVQNFQQLLKLSKNGQTLTHFYTHKKSASNMNKISNKEKTSKTLNLTSPQENQLRYQNTQTDQIQMKKLNKMALGITQWEQSKKPSMHVQKQKAQRQERLSLNRITNTQFLNQKQNMIQMKKVVKNRKNACYSQDKKFREPYMSIKKSNIKEKMKRFQKMFKFKSNQHYPNILLTADKIIDYSQNDFKQIRQKIKQLQNKAKTQYGLSFQVKKKSQTFQSLMMAQSQNSSPCVQKENVFQKTFEHSPFIQISNFEEKQDEKEKEKIDDFRFQNSRIKFQVTNASKKFHKQYENILLQEHILGDTSVPSGFMRIVNNNSTKKLKMKRLNRPKSFAPNHSYIRVT